MIGNVEVASLTTRESLHRLVDELPEDQTELARVLLEDLRDAADPGGLPLDDETVASLDRGLAHSPRDGSSRSTNTNANAGCELSRLRLSRSRKSSQPARPPLRFVQLGDDPFNPRRTAREPPHADL